jgi:Domain of unknown function (DUF3387)
MSWVNDLASGLGITGGCSDACGYKERGHTLGDRRASRKVLVIRTLRKYEYPPDLRDAAIQNLLQRAEVMSAGGYHDILIWTEFLAYDAEPGTSKRGKVWGRIEAG